MHLIPQGFWFCFGHLFCFVFWTQAKHIKFSENGHIRMPRLMITMMVQNAVLHLRKEVWKDVEKYSFLNTSQRFGQDKQKRMDGWIDLINFFFLIFISRHSWRWGQRRQLSLWLTTIPKSLPLFATSKCLFSTPITKNSKPMLQIRFVETNRPIY